MQRKRRSSQNKELEIASDKLSLDKKACLSKLLASPRTPLDTGAAPRVTDWSTEDVVSYLSQRGYDKFAPVFKEHQIEGRHLVSLDRQDLLNMGIRLIGDQKDLLSSFASLQSVHHSKVFNDPIHGHIELHPLLVKIIDTPEFQRLRNIKQLGACYYVFPGASHNRFEHCIGVCHLAGELVETLRARQPELGIDDKDVLCVMMAGLCHDLGHGPFSHMFDGSFIPRVRPGCNWKHEDASVTMFDHLVMENKLGPALERYGIKDRDLEFVKEQIAGPRASEQCSQLQSTDWPYTGREIEKSFLYEIVANKKNGIDVDKWDYFARDCHHLGISINFDYHRFMKFARVIQVNERLQICIRDKEVANLYDMFHTRSTLHRRAYQHKTVNIIGLMIVEALVAANDHLVIPGKDGRGVKMSDSIDDMYAFTNLTDHVIQQIMLSTDPQLERSRQLLRQVLRRQLYKCVGQTQPGKWEKRISRDDYEKITRQLIASVDEDHMTQKQLPVLTVDDILIDVVTFDYGMREENPIDHVRFYLKKDPQRALKVRKDQVSHMLPGQFTEQQIRVYSKRLDDHSCRAVWEYFINWCRKQDCITPKGGSHVDYLGDDNEDDDVMTDEDVTPYNTPFGTPIKEEERRSTVKSNLTRALFSGDSKPHE